LTLLINFIADSLDEVPTTRLFDFPDPVNETSARLVAGGVVAMAVTFLVAREGWLLVPLTYGFAARVATGPTLSPLGSIVTRFVTPAVETRLRTADPSFRSRQVPGPPKRFAQAIGLLFTAGASFAWMVDAPVVAAVLIAVLTVAAGLEAFAGICLGCVAHSAIWGCSDCDDIADRLRQAVMLPADHHAPSTPTVDAEATTN
jgi:hypothetical protein